MVVNPETSLARQVLTEVQPREKVQVAFHGFGHSEYNLQSLQHIQSAIDNHLSFTGNKTLFVEFLGTSDADAARYRKFVRDYGFRKSIVNTILQEENSDEVRKGYDARAVTLEQINDRIDAIDHAENVQEVLDKNLIPQDKLWQYYFGKLLEEKGLGVLFTIDFESYSDSIVSQLQELYSKEGDYRKKAENAIIQGDLDSAIAAERASLSLHYQMSCIREKAFTEKLKEKTKRLSRQDEGGSILILGGAVHDNLLDGLQRKVPNGVKYKKDEVIIDRSLVTAFNLMREGKAIPDEVVARQFLWEQIMSNLAKYYSNQKNIDSFAFNFETIEQLVDVKLEKMSIEEMRAMAQNGNLKDIVVDIAA